MYMLQLTVQYPGGFFCQLIFKMWPAHSWNVLGNSKGVHYTCTWSGIYHTRQYIKCLPLQFLNVRCWMKNRHFWDPSLLLLDSLQDSLLFFPAEWKDILSQWIETISSACCRCKWDRTDTCVQWGISSSLMPANKASLLWRACASTDSWSNEALCWVNSSCNSWSFLALCPMPSLMSLNARAPAGEELGSNCSGFIMTYGRCLKYASYYFSTGKIISLDEQMTCVMNADSVKCP